jgi:hypothetical protein
MKLVKSYFIILLINFIVFCSPKNKGNNTELLFLLNQFQTDTNSNSVIEIKIADFYTYTGQCYDNFLGMSSSSYYELHFPVQIRDLPEQKSKKSSKICSELGFSGGVSNRLDKLNLTFKSYSWSVMTSSCSNSAIKEVGY